MDSSGLQGLAAAGKPSQPEESPDAARRIDNFLSDHSQSKLPAHLAHLRGVGWTKATSKDGLPYLYGFKSEDPTEEIAGTSPNSEAGNPGAQAGAADNPLPRYVSIFWDVQSGTAPAYIEAEKEAQEIGLKDHRIMDLGWALPYELDFHNTSSWSFRFENATGDFFDITTPRNGLHFILYYSHSPNLRWVTNRLI